MKKIGEIFLGILTGIGGFLEAGSLATSAQAGAEFGFRLGWAILLGTICLALLVEMSGRLAAESGHTIPDAMRDRYGSNFFLLLLVVVGVVSFLVLAAEIGGVCLALELATGVALRWWAPAVALAVWLFLWTSRFGVIEKGPGLLGLVTLAFAVAAVKLHPPAGAVARGLLPSLPTHQPARYWFLAVSIFGASVSPYLFYFYSAAAVEGRWDRSYLAINRVTAGVGMTFGGAVSLAALVCAAMVMAPRGIRLEQYQTAALLLTVPLGRLGLVLFVAALGVACFGAATELALSMAYFAAQGLGWNWSKDRRPREVARFSLVYTAVIPAAALPILAGVDPLKVTVFSMALSALSLPLTVVPLLTIMNDSEYVGEETNHWSGNAALLVISGLAAVVALVAFPLQLLGGD